MKLLKKIKKKEISPPIYYVVFFAIPMLGVFIKNLLLQAYINGENLYNPSIINSIKETYKYWTFYMAITLVVFGIALLIKKDSRKKKYLYIMMFATTILLCCDLIYSRSFFSMPSIANSVIFLNFSGFGGGEVSSLLSGYDILFFADIICYIAFFVFFEKENKVSKDEQKHRVFKRIYAGIFILSTFVITAIPIQAKIFEINKDAYNEIYKTMDTNKQAKYFSSLGFHIVDIVDVLEEKFDNKLSKEEIEKIDTFYEWKNEDLPDNEYSGIFEGKNVIFFQIESLESFVIGEKINGQEITPNINKLLKGGMYFNNLFEQVQGGNSSDADLMYMSSRLPIMKGCTFFSRADVKLPSFPRFLVEQGYSTTYHQAIRAGFWNYENALESMLGMDNFVGIEAYEEGEKIGFALNDKTFLEGVYPYVKKLNEPFYAHIVCNTSHMPFKLRDELKELNLDKDFDDTYIGGYLQTVRYVDTYIGELLEKLEKDGLLLNTVIVITGDHTGINKYYEYSIKEYYEKYPWLDIKGNYTVPLIIKAYGEDYEYKSDVIAGQIDLMPTLCYLFGIDKDKYLDYAMGRNLLNTNRSYAIYRDGTIHGELTKEENDIVKSSYEVSNSLFRVGK